MHAVSTGTSEDPADRIAVSKAGIKAGSKLGLKRLYGIIRGKVGQDSTTPLYPAGLIKAELFSIERLEQFAADLAAAQCVTFGNSDDRRLEHRLQANQQSVRWSYHECLRAIREELAITPAADWLVNNFHLIEEQVRDIRVDLPPAFHRRLPRLTGDLFTGYPRIFAIAWEFVAHTDSEFDAPMMCRFLQAYQRTSPLTIGEIWAFPITLRIVLVENLRRLADEIVKYQTVRRQANAIADRLLGAGNRAPETVESVLGTVSGPLSATFAVQLGQRLREQASDMSAPLLWIDQRLMAQGTTTDDEVHFEQQHQIAINVAIRNVITSMRLLSSLDWRRIFESVSLVDALLRAESNFADLDFATRDQYRRAIEKLSRDTGQSEVEITRQVLQAGGQTLQPGRRTDSVASARRRDPGYRLVGGGRLEFAAQLGVHPSFRGALARANAKIGIAGYIALAGLITLIMVWAMLGWAIGPETGIVIVALGALALLPASDAAMALLNCGATARFDAISLPGLELAAGIPPGLRTMVVMPILLTTRAAIATQIEHLEVHYLANRDSEIAYALLSDWCDCSTESATGDADLVQAASSGIAALNKAYGAAAFGDRFRLLHRARQWNAQQQNWMGWERKRGKIHELNRLLRGATDTSFIATQAGPARTPPHVRYVVVVDADTRLPRGTVRRLVGKMAHPLNRPSLDSAAQRVVDGYAILQPRVTPALPTGNEGSLFQSLFAGYGGMDPYACAVSDVYQDLFGEGSYCGKGIYDVDAFEAALAGRIPENMILSHDLLEGIFARAGLVSDIELIDEFPARYDVALARQHRWVRGDWQLLPWIVGGHKAVHGGEPARMAPLVGRWKMIDNLRRSLSAPCTFVALVAGWMLPPVAANLWTCFIIGTIALPVAIPVLTGILPRRSGLAMRVHVRAIGQDIRVAFLQVAILIAFLPIQAWVMSDAIARTLFRLGVSRRNLLQWVTAAQERERPSRNLVGWYRDMRGGMALAAAAGGVVFVASPATLFVVLPFVTLWAFGPAIARWISLPLTSQRPLVSTADAKSLRLVARRTWRFFETFVTAQENMLPPDNFQEDPKPVIAPRTSPTNMGLYLLSVVSARDFGWLGLMETTQRLESTLHSMDRLERFRGHFFNWYDTRSLAPLPPTYVSSVDSGNLAGHLLALAHACDDFLTDPILSVRWHDGIADPLDVLCESMTDADSSSTVSPKSPFRTGIDDVRRILGEPHGSVTLAADQLAALSRATADLVAAGKPPPALPHAHDNEVAEWAIAVESTAQTHQHDMAILLPWVTSGMQADQANAPGTAAARSWSSLPIPSLQTLPALCAASIAELEHEAPSIEDASTAGAGAARDILIKEFRQSAAEATALASRIAAIRAQAMAMFDAMEFGFLFDADRELLSIGYSTPDARLDKNCYDLLASEARLASIIAIAKDEVPTRHWFRLGRGLTPIGWDVALMSWSGSMFEYLMPSLVMRAPYQSLLERTNLVAVGRQISYGAEQGRPWGTSESAYNARDLDFTYQYSSFGIADLGLKRGLGENTVIAPYATALAAMVDPGAAVRNFAHLATVGARGHYGWYESLDYTKSRVPEGAEFAIVRAYMAHHQGMSIVAIADTLHDGAMRRRFHAAPVIQATELLLQERKPRDVISFQRTTDSKDTVSGAGTMMAATQRRFSSPHTSTPEVHLLSNGSYAVMVTASGAGYSRWRNIAVTRWREDATCDDWGAYVFLRDRHSGRAWSAAFQPSGTEPDRYEAAFSEGRAQFSRDDGTITTGLEIAVSAEDDAEVRRVSITNHGSHPVDIEVTSYAELVLAQVAADDAHQAFSKLFIETEYLPEATALIATRRLSRPDEAPVWAAHLAVVEGESSGPAQFETDRARFLGRGGTVHAPASMAAGATLSGTAGAVLDPIFSMRCHVLVPPGTTARVAFWTLIAASRAKALDLIDKHRSPMAFERATTLAWTQAQVQLRHLGITAASAHLYQRLANHVLYSDPSLRPVSAVLKRGNSPQSSLWSQGISGDLPIILACVGEGDDITLIRQLVVAHEYWRLKGLDVDLVVLNDSPGSYAQDLQDSLHVLANSVRIQRPAEGGALRGAILVLRTDHVSVETRNLLHSAARAVLFARRGNLADQFIPIREALSQPTSKWPVPARTASAFVTKPPDLEFENGIGGFADRGRDYVAVLQGGETTPMPWINVISNGAFGFQVSLEGTGYSWSLNSQQNQITAWSNDPVTDRPGEVIYIRDEESGEIWGPTAFPLRDPAAVYSARHGQGFTRFEHTSHGVRASLLVYVPLDDPIKVSRLQLTDLSGRARRLSVTSYTEWVLGTLRAASAAHTVTEIDAPTGAMLARNPWNNDHGQRVAFADLGGGPISHTGDRAEFIGRNGRLDRPACLASAAPLSNRTGAGLDPCAAMQVKLELAAFGSCEIVLLLGQEASAEAACALVQKYRAADLDAVLAKVCGFWNETLTTVQVNTPDAAMDIMLNRWLLYQTLSCRLWARSAFYQASGAYGFRDQLQDVMALCVSRPSECRAHLLRAASRQFIEGDAQHWWLPQSGRGIRTRISDDRVWLAHVAAYYVHVTGDLAVLDELVGFLEGPVLSDNETDAFFQPVISAGQASLFEHCARALDASMKVGVHGLPLIGTGDWNDGLNRVGEEGRGESVWLGWLLCDALQRLAPLADARGECARGEAWRNHAEALAKSLEQHGWDGKWYRRAYFDDGTPLGSADSAECRIDSIVQSWAVLSGAASAEHATAGMAAIDINLVRRDTAMVLLFTPPFDRISADPGYIKGYPPGIRENGGQYTHGAVWSVMAFAKLGDGDKAFELFSMLNPINHARTSQAVERYKVEPYVVSADIYAMPPHIGRGGWTWYTGSAGLMYRAGLESILGFRLQGATLCLDPCIPATWPGFKVTFRYHGSIYDINVENPQHVNHGVTRIELDGIAMTDDTRCLPLVKDGQTHRVTVTLG
jgi:cyclic beta-1,2-glucan synthetase